MNLQTSAPTCPIQWGEDWGMRTVEPPAPAFDPKNPYVMSPERARQVAQKAGILTKSGRIAPWLRNS